MGLHRVLYAQQYSRNKTQKANVNTNKSLNSSIETKNELLAVIHNYRNNESRYINLELPKLQPPENDR